MSQRRKTSIQPPREPPCWLPPHSHQQPGRQQPWILHHRHHCHTAGAGANCSSLGHGNHFVAVPTLPMALASDIPEKMSDLPSPSSLAILFGLPTARVSFPARMCNHCLSLCAGMRLSWSRACSSRTDKSWAVLDGGPGQWLENLFYFRNGGFCPP